MDRSSYAEIHAAPPVRHRRRRGGRALLWLLVVLGVAALALPRLKALYRPQVLRAMAERNPETEQFVQGYPGREYLNQPIDLSGDYTPGQTPLFLQWDSRWGYAPYGGDGPEDMIGLSGCGPTALSMVTVALTGNTDWNPKAVADYAVSAGHCTENDGTAWTLMTDGCRAMGLVSEPVPLDAAAMEDAIAQGKQIIASVGPGDFTTKGHFIVLCGYDGQSFSVRDPFSKSNSGKTWTYDRLAGQIVAMWAFSAQNTA